MLYFFYSIHLNIYLTCIIIKSVYFLLVLFFMWLKIPIRWDVIYMVPEFPSQRCQWRAKSGVETSHIYKKILFGRKEIAIVLRPSFSFRRDAESTPKLATGAESFSPGVKNISVLSATMPSLHKSLSIGN